MIIQTSNANILAGEKATLNKLPFFIKNYL